jgi:hypothetical protein
VTNSSQPGCCSPEVKDAPVKTGNLAYGLRPGADAGIVEKTLVSSTTSDRKLHLLFTDRVLCAYRLIEANVAHLSDIELHAFNASDNAQQLWDAISSHRMSFSWWVTPQQLLRTAYKTRCSLATRVPALGCLACFGQRSRLLLV